MLPKMHYNLVYGTHVSNEPFEWWCYALHPATKIAFKNKLTLPYALPSSSLLHHNKATK